jgi:hypothetical protein
MASTQAWIVASGARRVPAAASLPSALLSALYF